MIEDFFTGERRSHKRVEIDVDFVVAGGGMAGVCAAISAARSGVKVALIQDRPVLGGNASSEVRLWILGATSHMGNNNRWAREGGIIDEILVENTYKNKEGNPVLFDAVVMDKVLAEKNISLFLNTVIFEVEKSEENRISSITAFNPQNQTEYIFKGTYFCDATGDGLIGYLAGATYRVGAEDREEFNEKFAPDKESYGEKLGHSIFFYTKDAGKPVNFVPPEFAMSKEEIVQHVNRIDNPNYFNPRQLGCKFWWIEYGGRLDTIYEAEEIKYTLWKVIYGIWDYIKNSGKFKDVENLTLEWVGNIPGKRESRRFVGHYMLRQQDIVEQRKHPDVVAFGGWSLDLHPADGVFSKSKKACTQWHSKGVYQIPYRCYITPDIENMFLAGRIISASHVAFASSRVMATSAAGGEAVGTAAALCIHRGYTPAQLAEPDKIKLLQMNLIKQGAYLPQSDIQYEDNLLKEADIEVSSELQLSEIPFDGSWKSLDQSVAQMLPIMAGKMPEIRVSMSAVKEVKQTVELRISSKSFNHTPDITLETINVDLKEGENDVILVFTTTIPVDCYVFVCFMNNECVSIQTSQMLITGLVSVFNKIVPAVSNWGKQEPPGDIGVEAFEFWCPERRPKGHNIAMQINPAITCFSKENLKTSPYRPIEKPNAWAADLKDKPSTITLTWKTPKRIKGITLFTDTDYDHPMESVQWGHHDNRMPFCVESVEVSCASDSLVETLNFQTKVQLRFSVVIETDYLKLTLNNKAENTPVSLFGIQIHPETEVLELS
ncbi:FAD-dependent oxidoreductase [Proteiniphilum saccharofermentans]|uniref:FAD-dependent oxidoreductase n=1 Tax=Proteiniphilum saccharofermentans TaxID=1642647 RepID=UPI0028ABAF62|nr:FAD-dependent oxidoreductase [Proteiniphilum saccharofermentans]